MPDRMSTSKPAARRAQPARPCTRKGMPGDQVVQLLLDVLPRLLSTGKGLGPVAQLCRKCQRCCNGDGWGPSDAHLLRMHHAACQHSSAVQARHPVSPVVPYARASSVPLAAQAPQRNPSARAGEHLDGGPGSLAVPALLEDLLEGQPALVQDLEARRRARLVTDGLQCPHRTSATPRAACAMRTRRASVRCVLSLPGLHARGASLASGHKQHQKAEAWECQADQNRQVPPAEACGSSPAEDSGMSNCHLCRRKQAAQQGHSRMAAEGPKVHPWQAGAPTALHLLTQLPASDRAGDGRWRQDGQAHAAEAAGAVAAVPDAGLRPLAAGMLLGSLLGLGRDMSPSGGAGVPGRPSQPESHTACGMQTLRCAG